MIVHPVFLLGLDKYGVTLSVILLHFIMNVILKKQPLEVFYKKGLLKNFVKFKGKHLCQGLFFNKVAGVRLQFY